MRLIDIILKIFGYKIQKENNITSVSEVISEIKKDTTITPINAPYKTPDLYPIILKSDISKIPDYILNDNRTDKGVLEDFFLDYIKRKFTENINTNIKIDNKTPDFCYINKERNCYIVIEIDEPYTLNEENNLKPIHYKGFDDNRNKCLLDKGWNIIRFAEEQIALYPDLCVSLINNFINKKDIVVIKELKCWNYAESLEMIEKKHRDSYLPLKFTNYKDINSINKYRSFTIEKIVLENFYLSIDNSIIYFNETNNKGEAIQCWINKNVFINKLKNSVFGEKYCKYDYIDEIFIEDRFEQYYKNKLFLNGIGRINEKFFNLKNPEKFDFQCSEESLIDIKKQIITFCEEFKEKFERENAEKIKREEEIKKRQDLQYEMKQIWRKKMINNSK